MNVKIELFVPHNGTLAELQSLLEDLGDTLIKHGFADGNSEESFDCFMTIKESRLREYERSVHFVESEVKGAYSLVIPVKEEDGSTND